VPSPSSGYTRPDVWPRSPGPAPNGLPLSLGQAERRSGLLTRLALQIAKDNDHAVFFRQTADLLVKELLQTLGLTGRCLAIEHD
jgi:hypothetical protein